MVLNRHHYPAHSYYFHPPPPPPPSTATTTTTPSTSTPLFSIASAWEIAARHRNAGFLFRGNKLSKSPIDKRRFSRSCDELDNLEGGGYSNMSEFSKPPPSTPFRRRTRIIMRTPITASPMLFRHSPRNLRSKSNAAPGSNLRSGLLRPLQYSVTLSPSTLTIPVGQDHNNSG